ncbi:MAG: CGNR zinc finger domain-containing protein [Nocardioidaceae bacterium]
METPAASPPVPRELPIVGGHLALDFANTVDDPLGPARHDHAATYADVVTWSLRVGTVDHAQASRLLRRARRRPQEAAAALTQGHDLRDSLNEVFGGIADRAADVADRWTRLRPFVADAYATAVLSDAGAAPAWTWAGVADLDVVLHPVAQAAADLLARADLRRVKRCARCPWLFLDHSKNHSRRWCDMNDCGKAEKIERYVARRAAARRG